MDKSNQEIALEFIADNELLIGSVEGENFNAFWEHPTKVIELYDKILETLSNAHQIPQEVVDAMKPDLLNDACQEYVNLIGKVDE